MATRHNLQIQTININELNPAPYNPRKWSSEAIEQLTESIKRFGMVDPLLVNGAKERRNIVIGGHFRLKVAKDLGITEVPVVYVDIPEIKREQELNLRLNRNLGEWDYSLLADFDESLLTDVGFTSEELDITFDVDDEQRDTFNIKKELDKLDIKKIAAKKGDVYQLGDSRLMIGDSTIEANMLKLMNGEKADLCLTDPPYILDYLNAIRKGILVWTSKTIAVLLSLRWKQYR